MNNFPVLFGLFTSLGPMELMIVGAVALLLFGHRLPSVMRSLGSGITEFKKGMAQGAAEEESGGNVEKKP